MANSVNITINVTDANGGEAVQRIITQLEAIGPAGQAAGAVAAAGLDEVGTHALTSLDNVRLLRDDLGIRIPRAMEKAIASSSVLSGALSGIGSGLIAAGTAEILSRIGESIYDAYEKYIDVNAAAEEYQQTVEKTRETDVVNVRSIEDATLRYRELTRSALEYTSAAQGMSSSGWGNLFANPQLAIGQLLAARRTSAAGAKEDSQADEVQRKQLELQHQITLAQIDAAHAGDGALQGQAKITAELQKQLAIHKEDRQWTAMQDKMAGNAASPDSGKQLQEIKDEQARAAAHAQTIEGQRRENEEIRQLQIEAYDAQLSGIDLLEAQREQALAKFAAKYGQSAAAIDAINSAYASKEIAYLEKEWEEKGKQHAADLKAADEQLELIDKLYEEQDKADSERALHHQRTMDQIAKEEEQTARMMLPDWQQSELAIIDQYQERVRQFKEAEDQQLANTKNNAAARQQIEDEYSAHVIAAEKLMQAELQRNAADTRDRLASELSSFFNDPSRYIEQRAMNIAFEMMANQMMQVFQKQGSVGGGLFGWLFGMNGEMSTSTDPMTDLKSVMGGGGAGATLVSAGSTLTTAAAQQLSAAMALQNAATSLGMDSAARGGSINLGSIGGSASLGSDTAASVAAGGDGLGSTYADVGNGTLNADGSYTQDAQGLSTLGKYAGAAGGALTGAMGIYSAYSNSDPLGGALSGAISGAQIGALGGPVGMAVGAITGAAVGFLAGIFGDKGEGKAKDYDKGTVQPTLTKEMEAYDAGQAGYEDVAKTISDLTLSAKDQTAGWGSGARHWYEKHILPEIQFMQADLDRQEKGGRSKVTMSAAQYHSGGWVRNFGDFRTSQNEGMIHAMEEEYVVHPAAARANAGVLQAMSGGARFSMAGSGRGGVIQPANGSSGASFTIQALDAKSFDSFLRNGGARKIVAATNQATASYAGVGRG